jgi:predicted site-specific integrase-resolvase
MSDIDTASEQGRRFLAWRQKAERHGVSTRTLDRWAKRGIISAPVRVNGRKYGFADEQPRTDDAA